MQAKLLILISCCAFGCVMAVQAQPSAPSASGATPASRNSLGMEFVRIPAGEFEMGNHESSADMLSDFAAMGAARVDDLGDEKPLHRVRITRAFELGKTEVTRAQFAAFVAASGYVPESIADGTGGYGYNAAYDRTRPEKADAFAGRDPQYSWRNPGFAQEATHPVVNISWNDAQAMAAWLSQKEGLRYRLPTEAEWEYACKAGSTARYSHGNAPQDLAQWANTFDRSATPHWQRWGDQALQGDDGYAFTAPAASYPANAFGLHDMVGNVWEWVADNYDEAYYQTPATPSTGAVHDPQGPAQGHLKVRRGGSWHTWALYARCSYRNVNTAASRYTLLGMRLLREIP